MRSLDRRTERDIATAAQQRRRVDLFSLSIYHPSIWAQSLPAFVPAARVESKYIAYIDLELRHEADRDADLDERVDSAALNTAPSPSRCWPLHGQVGPLSREECIDATFSTGKTSGSL